jgi:hypothetical protein
MSGVQIIVTLACRQDTKPQKPEMHVKAMPNKGTIPAFRRRYQAQTSDLQGEMQILSEAWEKTLVAASQPMPQGSSELGGQGSRTPNPCYN